MQENTDQNKLRIWKLFTQRIEATESSVFKLRKTLRSYDPNSDSKSYLCTKQITHQKCTLQEQAGRL